MPNRSSLSASLRVRYLADSWKQAQRGPCSQLQWKWRTSVHTCLQKPQRCPGRPPLAPLCPHLLNMSWWLKQSNLLLRWLFSFGTDRRRRFLTDWREPQGDPKREIALIQQDY